MKKLSTTDMKKLNGGNAARAVCTIKMECSYYDDNDVLQTRVCRNRLANGVWQCYCGGSDNLC